MIKKNTVIFGGSFDPIHIGHTSLAAEVLGHGIAEEVWFMVSPQNPHKSSGSLSSEEHRLNMARLAIEGHDGFIACDFEFSLPRPSYTINTLDALSECYPDRNFILLIGADNWNCFGRWHRSGEILGRYGIVVYPRDSEERPELPGNAVWLPSRLYDVSSTMIRDAVSKGCSISEYVAPAVEQYIYENNLYNNL
jgi:nicotinate-nucleotide adenylyltransferase